MKAMTFCLLTVLALAAACSDPEKGAPVDTRPMDAFQPEAYTITRIPGSSIQRAERRQPDGALLEQGFLLDGKRTGAWVNYHPGGMVPKAITSYVEGNFNGIYMEFNDRGYLELRAEYRDNLLNGPWAKYRFGRPTNEATYVNGKLEGVYREYVMNTGNLQKEITYKNGEMDGPYRFYNDKGQVTLEYEYRRGEKVGGGIVDPSRPNEPR